MVRLAIIRDALSGEKELKNIDSRKTIKEIADKEFNSDVMETVEVYNQKTGETHYVAESVNNSSLKYFLNDKETDSLDYVLKDGDNLVIMASPKSQEQGATAGITFLGGVLGVLVAGLITVASAGTLTWLGVAAGFAIGASIGFGVSGSIISAVSSTSSTSTGSKSVESIPDAAGSSNTSLIGNKYPLVLGKHLITPFIAGTPYNETLTSDTYGKYTYVHLLLCAGYAPLKLTEFKLGDLVLAHNKDNTVTIDGVSHTNSRDTVLHGVLTGYDETDYDSGDILNRWKNNDVSLEILQKGDYSDSSRAYSDLYPQSCIQSEISATPLFVYDGAKESITTYKGSSFHSGYRTNTVRFSESCPTALEVEFNASNGLYRTRTETNDSNTSTVYNSLPIFIAVQWRRYKDSNSPSDANKGTGWNSFDSLNGVSPVSLTTEMMSTSTAAHEGNDLTSQTGDDAYSAYYNDWIGCSVFDLTQFSGTHDDSGSTDESSLSQMRFIARKSFTLDDCKKIAGITKDSDGNKYADLDSVEIRVVRIDSSYIDQTGSSDTSKYSSWSYNDLLKWTYLRTFQFDKTLLTSSSTLLSDCIKRPYSLPDSDKFCFIALKVKADLTGEITGQLDKFNCIAESFAPVLNTTTREWSISNVSKKYKYYDAGLTEIMEGEYEAGIDNGIEVYKKTSGNDFKDQLDSLLWTRGNYNTSKSRWYLPSSYESLYISNNIASVFLTAMLGGDLGNEAYCYNDINMQSVAAAFMYWNDVTDGSEYESGDDEYVSGGDNTIHMKWAFNGYITAATKQSTLIQNILTVGRGSLSIDESCRYKILIDKPRDYPVLTINQQNSMEETNTRSFEENTSGYQIEFQNEDDNYESSTLYAMMDGEDYTNPTGEVESANFKYITSPRQAWSMGRYNLARLIVVREYLERTLGIAGVTLELGDVVNVQDDTILVGTDMGGRIQKLISDDSYIYGFITDELYEYTGEVDSDGKCKKGVEVIQPSKWGASRIVTIRMATTAGVIKASGETLAPVVGKTNQVVFESPIVRSTGKLYSGSSIDVHIYEPEVDNIVAFGEVGSITSQYIVARITPQENFKYKILLYPYDESVYNYGSAMPVIQNNMTKPNRSGDGDITVDIGAQGIQGVAGTNGTDGKTSYFHVAYANSADGSIGFNQSSGTYIGTYVDYTATDSTSYSSYTWKKFVGDTGAQGAKGVAGTNGTDGSTSYLHMAYANSSDGKTDFSVSYFTNAKYLGTYTDFTEADSTSYSSYTWAVLKGDTGAKGATGATGAKGADGTDSTAITISAPSSTTPESGMKYDNTYYGIYSGIWYKWSWSSTTTGAWTQVSADTPPTPAVRYSFDEMPDLPDDSGAAYKFDKNFTAVPLIFCPNESPVSTFSGGVWTVAASGWASGYFLPNSLFLSKILILDITLVSGSCMIGYEGSATTYTASGNYKIPFYTTDTTHNYILYGQSSSTVFKINKLYIGDGTTSQPVIDNISGSVNAIANGVVSVPGVSGKACQFLGVKELQLDLSQYNNVQSWWTSRWLHIGTVASTVNPRFWHLSSKDYAFKDGGTSSSSSNTINIFTYNGTDVLGGGVTIPSGTHLIVVQTIITSSSSATKKVYVDGVLAELFTSTADFTSETFGTGYIGGDTISSSVMVGWQDDFQFGTGEITAAQVLGLYLQRASAAKLYQLADYNYDKSVSAWEITSSAASLSKSRAGVVIPSTVTFSAKAVIASVAQAYSGRFIIYTSTNGTTFSSVYTSTTDESSHAYSPAANISAIRVELYKSGGTSVLVATKDYSVPYDASVKPQYLGIGLIADVNGLTTKAFTGATITDAGDIKPGSSVSAVIPGDWLINYSAGGYRVLGIYCWSGSAWTITSDSKYTSDGVIEDICRLNNGGILIPDWTVYANLIADNLFSHKIKLTTKTISGVTYEGVFYGGKRFNADGSIADRTANGFYFKTDGKGWCNLQSDDLYNTIIGTNAGLRLISGSGDLGKYNSIYGMQAGYNLTTGYNNCLFGSGSGYSLSTGNYNTIDGAMAGYNLTTGNYNSVYGMQAGYSLTTGSSNSVFGGTAGFRLTTGYENCLFGRGAGSLLTTGYENCLFGSGAGYNLTTGNSNCLLGYSADGYTGAWDYQINLNNRILYLEFARDATQDTVYKALAHYIVHSAGSVKKVGAMGRFGEREILSIENNGDNNIDFFNNGNTIGFTAVSGSFTKIGYPLQVAFIVPAEPTNK